eukprot:Plantae.Rhodophyta-Purpureofilum_apyrenoidigerum.ctg25949.p1 GENE.Plantae.Rhodophyta-Purpureofilum_apyrenoidigerum.ctg25949~~Plantae.Rhodophyta-Purpureofilum_apyrenoidigerum.ctg25949.p1  ORF type:complete len:117 (-),score=22.65 Plantae.Rhodophyta-Purpureofilum_apyrenoidigerum.ctg25949:336-686(-)
MGKKKTASSSAAASLLPEHLRGSTFTSLSDITRRVVQDGTGESAAPAEDEWTEKALQLLMRVMKKGDVTRVKAMAELRCHVESSEAPPDNISFAKAFDPMFRRIITEEIIPAVGGA